MSPVRVDPRQLQRAWTRQAWRDRLFLTIMILTLFTLGHLVAGASGLILCALFILLQPFLASRQRGVHLLRQWNAQKLPPWEAPDLHDLVRHLTDRAGLSAPPALALVPDPNPNAFTVEVHGQPVIALTDGLLSLLTQRELQGVLAHEIAHAVRGDHQHMARAQAFFQATRLLSLAGQWMLLALVPWLLLGQTFWTWILLSLFLAAAPLAAALLMLALSRSREFQADLLASWITQDPLGLASALERIESGDQNRWLALFFPTLRRARNSSLLWQTHPATRERIRRLHALQPASLPLHGHLLWPRHHPFVARQIIP